MKRQFGTRKYSLSVWIVLVLLASNNRLSAETSAQEYLNEGVTDETSGKTDEAIEAYRKAIAVDPQHGNAWFNLGSLYARRKQWQEAVPCLKRAIELNPEDGEAHFNLAAAYGALQQPLEALEHYDRSQALGIQGDPSLGQLLEPYRDRESTLEYASLNEPTKKVVLHIQGNPLGEKTLLQDVVRNLQPF